MSRFARVLRRVERRLEAPEPERSRILMEVAADLEDLYQAYRERGMEEAEARRRAERWLAPSTTALASLRSVHLPALARLLDRLEGTRRGRIELGAATLVSLAAAAGGIFAALRSGALSPAAPGLWAVAGLGALGLGVGLRRAYRLFVRGDRLAPGWRRPGRVLAAAAGTAVAGLLAGAVRLILAAAPGTTGATRAAFWSEVSAAAGVGALALSVSLLLVLLWLVLRIRAEAVGRARAELREAVGSLDGSENAIGKEIRR